MKKILLVVCGGIAAYKAAELVRLLRKRGAEVQVVMTESAQQFVTPLTFQALSGHTVRTSLRDEAQEQSMSHIHLARWADGLIIAPATADFLAKMAHGLADDLASTLYLAAECPVYVAPAMNQAMWRKTVTQDNIARLKLHGVNIIGPESGEQACGELGPGRMTEAEQICAVLLERDKAQLFSGLQLIITAGPTREPLDPVRFISNRSSGKMGYALAAAAADFGASVTLISGPVNLTAPTNIKLINVETAAEMHVAVMAQIQQADIYIGAAAVADYRPQTQQMQKIKKSSESSAIQLEKTTDIISAVAALPNKPFIVGFAAETDDLENYALSKLQQKNLDMIAANWVGRADSGFDSDTNALQVYWRDGQRELTLTNKQQLAVQLLELIAERFKARSKAQPAR